MIIFFIQQRRSRCIATISQCRIPIRRRNPVLHRHNWHGRWLRFLPSSIWRTNPSLFPRRIHRHSIRLFHTIKINRHLPHLRQRSNTSNESRPMYVVSLSCSGWCACRCLCRRIARSIDRRRDLERLSVEYPTSLWLPSDDLCFFSSCNSWMRVFPPLIIHVLTHRHRRKSSWSRNAMDPFKLFWPSLRRTSRMLVERCFFLTRPRHPYPRAHRPQRINITIIIIVPADINPAVIPVDTTSVHAMSVCKWISKRWRKSPFPRRKAMNPRWLPRWPLLLSRPSPDHVNRNMFRRTPTHSPRSRIEAHPMKVISTLSHHRHKQ